MYFRLHRCKSRECRNNGHKSKHWCDELRI
nr:hypothetical protein [Leptospira interrogans]